MSLRHQRTPDHVPAHVLTWLRDEADQQAIHELWDAARLRFRALNRVDSDAVVFYPGDHVWFLDRKGQRVEGTISKVNRTTAFVRTGTQVYKVSLKLLNKTPPMTAVEVPELADVVVGCPVAIVKGGKAAVCGAVDCTEHERV